MNNLLKIKKSLAMLLALVILISIVGSATAQEHKPSSGGNVLTAPSQAPGPTDPAELEAFLDEVLATQMEENHIPGAAIAVVRDGEVLLAKGYGYANLEKGVSVDPEHT